MSIRRLVATATPVEDLIGPSTTPLLRRIAAEYREMPGLSLTAPQAARLLGIDRNTCAEVLQALVAAGRLRCTNEGHYRVAGTPERAARLAR